MGKTHLQRLATAAAINLKRVSDWLAGGDGEKTRRSAFARSFGGKPCALADGKSANCEGTQCVYGPCVGKVEFDVTAKEVKSSSLFRTREIADGRRVKSNHAISGIARTGPLAETDRTLNRSPIRRSTPAPRRPARSLYAKGGMLIDTVPVLRTRRRPSRPIWSRRSKTAPARKPCESPHCPSASDRIAIFPPSTILPSYSCCDLL